MKSEVWIKSYGLLKIFKITRVKNSYRGRRTVRCVFEAPRVLETVQYMSKMNALGLLNPKVTLGSEIGSLDQELRCYIHLSSPTDFEVPDVEKATSSDHNATNFPVQHTYGEDSAER